MFCDVCGFSRIMGEDESRALAVVGMATDCIESATTKFGGRVIKKLGDGVLCEFPSAVNAVRCAIEVQQAVAEHDRTAEPAQQFQMRIGIHVGDVVVADNDILGDGVNVASRIQPLAEPGGICISRDVFDLVKSRVSIETVNLGPHDLKNISRQIDIYKVLIDAVGAGPSPQPGAASAKTASPSQARRVVWIAVAGVAVLVALVGLLVAARAHRARQAFDAATREANELAAGGRTGDAIQRLRAFPHRFQSTSWQKKIDENIAQLEIRLAKEAISERQRRFFKAVADDDRNGALRLLDPEAVRTADLGTVWAKCRLVAGFLKLSGVTLDSLRIEGVDLAADGKSARVWMKLLKKTDENPAGTWDDIPPSDWRDVNGEWYLHPEPRPVRPAEREGRRPRGPARP
jgi:class 3 adenylate cyclase